MSIDDNSHAAAKSSVRLNELSSAVLRWRYGLMPPPSAFEMWGRERALAQRILAERSDQSLARTKPSPPSSDALRDAKGETEASANGIRSVVVTSPLTPIPNKPGKSRIKMDAAVAAMVKAVETRKISIENLCRMKQKSLVEIYPYAKRTLYSAGKVRGFEATRSKRR